MLLFSYSYISSSFQHSSCRINSTAALRENIHFGTDAPKHVGAFFHNYRERKSRESWRISVISCTIRSALGIFLTDS